MSSIRKTQIEQVLSDSIRLLYSQGVKPTSSAIQALTSRYFSENPAGAPLDFDINTILAEDGRSDADAFNEMLLKVITNLNVLYKTSLDQVDDVLTMNTELREKIARLKNRRKKLAAKIDDHLLSLYNSDGYYYSVSDSFSDLDLTDLSLTSAFVDTTEGAATLPMVSKYSNRVTPDNIYVSDISATVNGSQAALNNVSPVEYALDGNTNTVWSVEIETSSVLEVVLNLTLAFSDDIHLSRIDVDPYGLSPAQWAVSTVSTTASEASGDPVTFGSDVTTTVDHFVKRGNAQKVREVRFAIRKTKPDYEHNNGGQVKYRYIFGAKEIALSYQVYDNYASLVTVPLEVPGDGDEGFVIDAVSLSADYDLPEGSEINFYVAEDNPQANDISDFDWRAVQTVDDERGGFTTVRFDGTSRSIRDIKSNPASGDLKKIDPDFTNVDLTKRNPTQSIIDGVDVYRLAEFDESPLLDTLVLHEGVNTAKVYHTDLSTAAIEGLDWWATKRTDAETDHVRIDAGNEFFYGGDVGESGRSILVETYVDVPGDIEPVLATMKKSDSNAATWQVRSFLNGTETAFLDAGVQSQNVPWPFRKGLNHIAVLINIPQPSAVVPNPYIGTLDLMGGTDLYDYGLVRLDTWAYIDFFDMIHNQPVATSTFTIYEGELISKKKPTDNLRLVYSKTTDNGPEAVRVRADFSRESTYSTVTPSLNQYRLRFSYSED